VTAREARSGAAGIVARVANRHADPPAASRPAPTLRPADIPSAIGVLDMELIVLSGLGVIALLAIKFVEYCR
jgi:hypothetical protein